MCNKLLSLVQANTFLLLLFPLLWQVFHDSFFLIVILFWCLLYSIRGRWKKLHQQPHFFLRLLVQFFSPPPYSITRFCFFHWPNAQIFFMCRSWTCSGDRRARKTVCVCSEERDLIDSFNHCKHVSTWSLKPDICSSKCTAASCTVTNLEGEVHCGSPFRANHVWICLVLEQQLDHVWASILRGCLQRSQALRAGGVDERRIHLQDVLNRLDCAEWQSLEEQHRWRCWSGRLYSHACLGGNDYVRTRHRWLFEDSWATFLSKNTGKATRQVVPLRVLSHGAGVSWLLGTRHSSVMVAKQRHSEIF